MICIFFPSIPLQFVCLGASFCILPAADLCDEKGLYRHLLMLEQALLQGQQMGLIYDPIHASWCSPAIFHLLFDAINYVALK